MHTAFDKFVEGCFFLDYEMQKQSKHYELELMSVLRELPKEFSVHFFANSKYHDWYIGDFLWNRLAKEVSLSLFPPMPRQELYSARDKKRHITLSFQGVTAVEMVSTKTSENEILSSSADKLSAIYMMGFENMDSAHWSKLMHPRVYVCTIQFFNTERIKLCFDHLHFHTNQ